MNLRRIAKTGQQLMRRLQCPGCGLPRSTATFRAALNLPRDESASLSSIGPEECSLRWIDASEEFERPLPRLADGEQVPPELVRHRICRVPATFVAEFTRARFWGYYGGSVF